MGWSCGGNTQICWFIVILTTNITQNLKSKLEQGFMTFLYSLKLLGSNWVKALKFILYYIVIWGVCIVLLLPVIFRFGDYITTCIIEADILTTLNGVFQSSIGAGISKLILTVWDICMEVFSVSPALAIYGLLVVFGILPFLINIGKYTFCEMLYSYMTSKSKVGFWSALVRGLKKSHIYSACRTVYNLICLMIAIFAVYGVATIENNFFISYLLPLVLFVILVAVFTLNQLTVLGWMPALIVFNCNIFSAYRKGIKAVGRYIYSSTITSTLYFFMFWLLILIFGIYTMVVLVPITTTLLCVFNMVMFFSSQGMRFYYTNENIRTPKKLEEVDKINKALYII